MRWVLSFNPKNNLKFYVLCLSLIFFDSIGFIGTLLLGYIVDEGVVNHNLKVLLSTSVLAISYQIIIIFASYIIVQGLDNIGNSYERKIKEKCYKHFQSLDKDTYQKLNKGELMTVFTSDSKMANRYISYFFKTVGKLIVCFGFSLVFLLLINVKLTLIILIPLPFITVCAIIHLKNIRKNYKERRKIIANVNDFVRDNIEGNKAVRAFAKEEGEIKEMNTLASNLKNKVIDLTHKNYYYWSFVRFGSELMNILFFVAGGIFLIKGEITLGSFVMAQSFIKNIRKPFIRIGELIDRQLAFNVSKDRINDFLNVKPKIINTGNIVSDNILKNISIKNVTIEFENQKVIENLSLNIKPNETIAFIGPTGSGKSSIVNLLLRLVDPSKGEIRIDNINIKDYNLHFLRNKIGYVSQRPFLFSDTIFNNIAYGNLDLTKEEALDICKKAKMDFIDRLPDGLDTVIGERGVMLSGGEKQRLSLARALAVKPNILILDDITSALDIETENAITKEIYNLDFECTKVIIAGKIVSVKFADTIYVTDKNKIIESGSHEELLKKKGYYYKLYELQKDSLLEGDMS